MNQPTKIGIVLAFTLALAAIALFHHRPASSDYTDPIGHYADQGQAWAAARAIMIDGDEIRPFHATRTTQSMGQVFADPVSGKPLPAWLVVRPSAINEMQHRQIGLFRQQTNEGHILTMHRYYSLPLGQWSISGDGNRGADERVTNQNHYGRLIYAAMYPRDDE